MAEKVINAVPSMKVVRMVNSGTEAVMSAIRLARGYTGRNVIVKFEGCYHGHSDSLLVKAGSGLLSLGIPECPGIVADLAKNTLNLPYNGVKQVMDLFASKGQDIACVIVEPVAGNMGVVPPQPGFLQLLRDITRKHGALLIFDEVITGFRVSFGGAQELYGVDPDLTCLGKILGGAENMHSPTFVIEKIYEIDFKHFKRLIHVDAYRLEKESELLHLGWEDLIKEPENLVLIEWPENVAGIIPEDARKISFKFIDNTTREISFDEAQDKEI